jgi:hypothetical protein
VAQLMIFTSPRYIINNIVGLVRSYNFNTLSVLVVSWIHRATSQVNLIHSLKPVVAEQELRNLISLHVVNFVDRT